MSNFDRNSIYFKKKILVSLCAQRNDSNIRNENNEL